MRPSRCRNYHAHPCLPWNDQLNLVLAMVRRPADRWRCTYRREALVAAGLEIDLQRLFLNNAVRDNRSVQCIKKCPVQVLNGEPFIRRHRMSRSPLTLVMSSLLSLLTHVAALFCVRLSRCPGRRWLHLLAEVSLVRPPVGTRRRDLIENLLTLPLRTFLEARQRAF